MAIHKTNSKADEIKYEVQEDHFVAKRSGGYELRLRFMSWNGKEAKYDLRTWKIGEDGEEKCGKGIGLSGEELEALGELIKELTK